MINLYTTLLFIHIGSAALWIGCAFALEMISLRIGRNGRQGLEQQISLEQWFGPHIFTPISILTLLSGITLVFYDGFGFAPLWIKLGLLGIILAILLGALGITSQVKQIDTLLKQNSSDDKLLQAKMKRIHLASYASFILLLLILLDMIVKPIL